MAYILPRVQIEQEFTQLPVFADQPLSALIIGPQYKLFRYSQASEKSPILASGNVAAYTSASNNQYDYPGDRPSTSVVDTAWESTSLIMENAYAKYLPNTDLGSTSSTITWGSATITNYPYRLLASQNLKTIPSYSRHSSFSNRDVTVGDVAYVSRTGLTTWTTVRGVYQVSNAAAFSLVDPTDKFATEVSTNGAAPNLYASVAATAYTGTKELTYKVTCTRAGLFWDGAVGTQSTAAKIRVTSSGTDSNPEQLVIWGTDFDLGTLGLKAQFNAINPLAASTTTTTTPPILANSLELGDIYYIKITPAGLGAPTVIEFADDISTGSGAYAVELYVNKASVVIPQLKDNTGNANWTLSSAKITVNSSITITEPTLVAGSTPAKLPLVDGPSASITRMYLQYRALLKDSVQSISSLSLASSVSSMLGPVNPDNPLAEGVYDALLNSSNAAVYYLGVTSNDVAGYNAALELAAQSDRVYSIVPMTFDSAVHDAVVAHVGAMSTPEVARWRIAWISRPLTPTALLVDKKADGSDFVAYSSDDGLVSGTQYTVVNIPTASLYGLARVGDSVLINFMSSTVYTTATVVEVRSNTQLVVDTDVGNISITYPVKVQVRRNYTKDEQINNLAASGSSYDNRRVRVVFPDSVKTGSVVKQGFYVAAALAGLRSGVVPHQSLTNIELLGFDNLSKSVYEFTQTQLNALADSGYWIVTQAIVGAVAYTRHQLTTDRSGLNFSEDSITTNVDSISYGLQRALSPYIGIYNINPENAIIVRAAIDQELSYRKTNTFTVRAGNQLIGYNIKKVSQNATFKDKLDVDIEIEPPRPMNNIRIKLIV